jgi:hypothetical protein
MRNMHPDVHENLQEVNFFNSIAGRIEEKNGICRGK